MRTEKVALQRYDRRDKADEPIRWATITHAVGEFKARDRVNSNQLSIGALDRLVSAGYATWDDERALTEAVE